MSPKRPQPPQPLDQACKAVNAAVPDLNVPSSQDLCSSSWPNLQASEPSLSHIKESSLGLLDGATEQ